MVMPPRHSLLWLSADGWATVSAQVSPCHRPALVRWCQADWPVIVRRQEPDCAPDQVCIGIALPPDPGSGVKHRLPLRIAASTITRRAAPLAISDVIAVLPSAWQSGLAALAAECVARQVALAVYGSAAWQAITGLRYLHATSDLDVLLQPVTRAQLDIGLALLLHHSAALPLDGEIVFPSGAAVAWKEWAAARRDQTASRVLVKQPDRVALVQTDILLLTLGCPEPASEPLVFDHAR